MILSNDWSILISPQKMHVNIQALSCILFDTRISMVCMPKKIRTKKRISDVDMALMVEKSIRGGMCHAIYWYVWAKNKYMKDYVPNKEYLYLMYWEVNNVYGQAMQ